MCSSDLEGRRWRTLRIGGRRNIQGKEVACTKACRGKWREAGGGWAGMKTLGLVKEIWKGFPGEYSFLLYG